MISPEKKGIPTKITIITVVLNDVQKIESTLLSVLNQKSEYVEYIVIDGLSSDGTMDVITKYRNRIDLLISEKDNGIYDAINKGIRLSHGSLIGLVHSGDCLLPGVLSLLYTIHLSRPYSIIYGSVKLMNNGEYIAVTGTPHTYLTEEMIPHPGIFIPKEIYLRHGLYSLEYSIASDYDALLRYYINGVDFHLIDRIISTFDLSGISSKSSQANKEALAIKRKYKLLKRTTVKEKMLRWLIDTLKRIYKIIR